jgi:hypothetical protein
MGFKDGVRLRFVPVSARARESLLPSLNFYLSKE